MARAAVEETVALAIEVQGTIGSPSRVQITGEVDGVPVTSPFTVRVQVCNAGTYADSTNATIAPAAGYGTTVATHTATKDLDIVSVEANATGTLTLTGAAADGETVTIGSRVYEFDSDGSVVTGRVAVDISASVTAAQGTLTVVTQPTALDSFEIGGRGYVFVADGLADTPGEISVGTDLATAQANIVAAINGTDGVNTAHESVSIAAFAANAAVVTALVPGLAGNSITSTENFTAVGNVFNAATLGTTTAGTDAAAAAAVTALVAAITGDTFAVVTAVDGAGDTVDVTADVAGYAGDVIATTETMPNGSFAETTLTLGSIPSEMFVTLTDAVAETVTVRVGQPNIGGLNASYHDVTLNVAHA